MNRALAALPDMASATDFSASTAKAKLGEVIDLVAAGGLATITRRGRQRFAVLKLEVLEALITAAKEQELESLGGRYDELVARMQSAKAKAAVDALFTASADAIGEGAARGTKSAAARPAKPGNAASVEPATRRSVVPSKSGWKVVSAKSKGVTRKDREMVASIEPLPPEPTVAARAAKARAAARTKKPDNAAR